MLTIFHLCYANCFHTLSTFHEFFIELAYRFLFTNRLSGIHTYTHTHKHQFRGKLFSFSNNPHLIQRRHQQTRFIYVECSVTNKKHAILCNQKRHRNPRCLAPLISATKRIFNFGGQTNPAVKKNDNIIHVKSAACKT